MKRTTPANTHSAQKFVLILGTSFFLIIVYLFYRSSQIKNIKCYLEEKPCPESVSKKIEESLLHKNIFFTNLDKNIDNWKINKVTRTLPSTLNIWLEPTLEESQHLTFEELLEEYQIPVKNIEEKDQIWIIYLDTDPELRALVNKDNPQEGLFKISHVLKEVNLKEIDLSILEIDARFKLVVLKTKYSEL
jgi:hypothetical protein